MNIKIKKHFLVYKGYKIKCCIGKSGISSMKKEGDLSTPKGIFKLGSLYYRKDRINTPKCKIKKRILLKKMGWCNDSKSKNYNKEIKFPFKYKAERLYRKDGIYDLFINIKYNFRPVIKKKGSAIFLHLSDDRYKPTEGCVAITKKDFLKILPLITKDTKISIG
tara:strand:+ start:2815 stop:3306 length:492 start_codon:yes stop_codon:yes gene_type:complete